jgi:riboflavin kinase/FMN adenylyltransferase
VQRWRGVESLPDGWGPSVVTVGVFDGVHRGHQRVIGEAVRRAAARGLPAALLTFDPHPIEVVQPGTHPARLTTLERRLELCADLGVDGLCVQPFTPEFSAVGADAFVEEILVQRFRAAVVVVGENFRYGHRASGDCASLAEAGLRWGFEVVAVPLVTGGAEEATYSSSRIRALLAEGKVATAGRALGRPHRVEGEVIVGEQRGRSLGFPTANLATTPSAAIPAEGVYAGWLIREGGRLPAAISIGTKPTFGGTELCVEAFVLDFSGDLYREWVALDFVARVRGMEAFDSVEELVAAVTHDVTQVRELLAREPAWSE